MKKTILICGLLIVGLMLLSGCHTYNTRVALGVDYYGDYGYPYYPYGYDPYYAYASYYPDYPYYYQYYPYDPFFFSFGFSFVRVFDGTVVRVLPGGRGGGGRGFRR